MPTLDWLNRASAFSIAAHVPYRLLEQVSVHTPFARSAQLKGPAMAFGEQVGRPYREALEASYGAGVRVGDLKDKAAKTQFRQLVLEETWNIEPDWSRPLLSEASRYPAPAGSRYAGRYEFRKHLDGQVTVVESKGAHLLNDPYEIEKRQIGELWARKSQGHCRFGQIAKARTGVDTAGQLDALLA